MFSSGVNGLSDQPKYVVSGVSSARSTTTGFLPRGAATIFDGATDIWKFDSTGMKHPTFFAAAPTVVWMVRRSPLTAATGAAAKCR